MSWPVTNVINLLKVITRQRSWWASNPRPLLFNNLVIIIIIIIVFVVIVVVVIVVVINIIITACFHSTFSKTNFNL